MPGRFFIGDEFEAVVDSIEEDFFGIDFPWQSATVLGQEWRQSKHRWVPDEVGVYQAALVPAVFEVVDDDDGFSFEDGSWPRLEASVDEAIGVASGLAIVPRERDFFDLLIDAHEQLIPSEGDMTVHMPQVVIDHDAAANGLPDQCAHLSTELAKACGEAAEALVILDGWMVDPDGLLDDEEEALQDLRGGFLDVDLEANQDLRGGLEDLEAVKDLRGGHDESGCADGVQHLRVKQRPRQHATLS